MRRLSKGIVGDLAGANQVIDTWAVASVRDGVRTAPCSPASCSRASDSVRCMSRPRAIVVAAAIAFSSSVSVMMRSVRISSISVPSKRSPGTFRGNLRIVVKDDRRGQHGVSSPGRPTRTGQTPRFRQAAVASRRDSGGSVKEKNFPPVPPRRHAWRRATASGPRRGCGGRHLPAACG